MSEPTNIRQWALAHNNNDLGWIKNLPSIDHLTYKVTCVPDISNEWLFMCEMEKRLMEIESMEHDDWISDGRTFYFFDHTKAVLAKLSLKIS